jgi:hypothetical protein
MGRLLRNSINGDLTIDDRRNGLWESWEGKGVAAMPFEDGIKAVIENTRRTK